MKITEVKDLSKYLIGAIPIGRGSTAICFYMSNGKLLKVYYKNSFKEYMMGQLELFNKIGNESFIVPEEVLVKDNKCVAQIYDYIYAPTLTSMNFHYNVSDILNAYGKLIEDTKDISDKNFLLEDLHGKNILFDGSFYVIDLDRGKIGEESSMDKIITLNVRTINEAILYSLFKVKYYQLIEFKDPIIQDLYYKSRCSSEMFPVLLEKIISDTDNASVKRIAKKIEHEKYINSYRF